MMETFWQDLKFSFRILGKERGFAATAVLTLALGIGATTAIFSVLYGVLLRSLPYPEPEKIVQVWQVGDKRQEMSFSEPNFEDVAAQSRSFQALALYAASQSPVLGANEPVSARGALVSDNFFRVLGVQPVMGRPFAAEELRQDASPVVLVSHGFWQRYLGGGTELGNRTLTISNRVFTVVGVMPPGFSFPPDTDLWAPNRFLPRNPSRTAHNWRVVGRLAGGATLAQAQQELSGIARRLKQQYGSDTWMEDASAVPLRDELVGPVRKALVLLFVAVGFLLLVACTNVVNLLLTQAASRQRELAVRMAMGASPGRLARQFLAESLVLALAGGVAGVLLAAWGVDLLLALDPGHLPRREEIGLNGMVLAFALGVSVLTAAGLGLMTATRAARADLQAVLKEGSRSIGGSGSRLRGALTVAQISLTLVLLVGTGLLTRSFSHLLAVSPGFRTEGVVLVDLVHPTPQGVADRARLARTNQEVMEQLRALPGVRETGGVTSPPLGAEFYPNGMFVKVRPGEIMTTDNFVRWRDQPGRAGDAEFRVASEDYFRAMGIPLLRGRFFNENDGPDTPHVAVISESLARASWPDQDPLGQLVQFGNMDGDQRLFTIVGIVGDVRERGLDGRVRPAFYGFFKQRSAVLSRFSIVARVEGDAAAVLTAAQRMVRQAAPDSPAKFRTVEQALSFSLADRRFNLLLFSVFGATALLLAVAGIYGVTSHWVSQRTREIGIRMALGARRADISRLVMRQGIVLAGLGAALGLVAAYAGTRAMATLLYEVKPSDPATFLGVAAILLATALAACYLPARRATRVDPMVALRYE